MYNAIFFPRLLLKTILLKTWEAMPNYFITSSSNGVCQEAVLGYIEGLNKGMDLEVN